MSIDPKIIFMPRLLLWLSCIILIASCSTEHAPPVESTEHLAFLDKNILERADITVTNVDAVAFQSLLGMDHQYLNIANLCKKSKGYQSNTWEGLNDCSWAVEQERITRYEHIQRAEDRLLIRKANGILELEHVFFDDQPTRYQQFGGYLPANNYYIIEQLQANQCVETKLIHHENKPEYILKGRIIVNGRDDQFYLLSQKLDKQANCINKVAYYGWSEEGLTKTWELPLKNYKITEAKVNSDGTLYLALQYTNKQVQQQAYVKIML